MAAAGQTSRSDSSAGELSPPQSEELLSEPTPPAHHAQAMERSQIVVGSSNTTGDQPEQSNQPKQISFQQYQQPPQLQQPPAGASLESGSGSSTGRSQRPGRFEIIDGRMVQLTVAGIPRKKPGRKPGTVVKTKTTTEADPTQPPKSRKPRKPRDPPVQPALRKRKLAPTSEGDAEAAGVSLSPAAAVVAHETPAASVASQPPRHQQQKQQQQQQQQQDQQLRIHRYSPKIPKRDMAYPGSMQSILNADLSVASTTSAAPFPVRSSGLSYDPIRGNYDPVRETIAAHGGVAFPPSSNSPRAPAQLTHRSPSIASMLEPPAPTATSSPPSNPVHPAQSRLQASDLSPIPPSPPHRQPPSQAPNSRQDVSRDAVRDAVKDVAAPPPPPPTVAPTQRPVVNQAKFTISNGPVRKADKTHTGVSTPRTDNADEVAQDSEGRSILDFGKAKPGEEMQAPTIILTIPIKSGETNKYVNFMRMAEERYGWDALHPRLAANRDRKARIAAAAASLEKVDSSRESGDEMSVDLSDGEGTNPENGGTSGPEAQTKPKKKRTFKEDQYDVDDDFVDDSEMLWEAQAAASRDGFFVYSGPLVPEVERPPAGQDGPPKRGRGSRGGRGGRGASRGGAGAGAGAGTGTGSGAGVSGGPGSRGGASGRKPRITKTEKLQREREKAERESAAQVSKMANPYSLQPTTPSFTVSELGA